MGSFFVLFFPHLWVAFTKDPFSTPYHCVSTSTDALSSEMEGLLSHQLTESGERICVSFDGSVGSVSNIVCVTAWHLLFPWELS